MTFSSQFRSKAIDTSRRWKRTVVGGRLGPTFFSTKVQRKYGYIMLYCGNGLLPHQRFFRTPCAFGCFLVWMILNNVGQLRTRQIELKVEQTPETKGEKCRKDKSSRLPADSSKVHRQIGQAPLQLEPAPEIRLGLGYAETNSCISTHPQDLCRWQWDFPPTQGKSNK